MLLRYPMRRSVTSKAVPGFVLAIVVVAAILGSVAPQISGITLVAADGFANGTWNVYDDTFTARGRMSFASRVIPSSQTSGPILEVFAFGGGGTSELYAIKNTSTPAFVRIYADNPPATTNEARLEVIGSKLFLAMGTTADQDFTRDVYSLDLSRQAWVKLAPQGITFPRPTRRHTSWAYGNYMVIYGGYTASGLSSEVWGFNTQSQGWELWDASALPGALLNPCCAVNSVTGKTLCFGGTSPDRVESNTIWVFDNALKTWSTLSVASGSPIPTSRRLALCAVDNNATFVMFGGYRGASRTYASDNAVWLFDLSTRTWRNSTGHGSHIIDRDHGAFAGGPDGKYYFWSGENSSGTTFNDAYTLDVRAPTPSFAQFANQRLLPSARFGHKMIQANGLVHSFFGQLAGGVYEEESAYWSLNVTAGIWTTTRTTSATITTENTVSYPPGRTGACLVLRGNIVYAFGGLGADKTALDDLWALSLRSNKWSRIGPHSASVTWPPARSDATCFLGAAVSVIIGLGYSPHGTSRYLDSWYGFDVTENEWLVLPVAGQTPGSQAVSGPAPTSVATGHPLYPSARQNAVAFDTRDGDWYVAFGKDTSTSPFSDMYRAAIAVTADGSATGITFTYVPTSVHYSAEALQPDVPYQIARQQGMIVAAAGNEFMFCGGHVSASFALTPAETCVAFSLATGQFVAASTPAQPTTYAGGAYIGNAFVLFGGLVSGGDFIRSVPSAAVQVFTTPSSAICPANPVVIDGCLLCSKGTEHPACTNAPKGMYVNKPGTSGVGCPLGTYNPTEGLTDDRGCINCPEGTYANVSGATVCNACPAGFLCGLGTANPVVFAQSTIDVLYVTVTRTSTSQPAPYTPISPPVYLYVAIAFFFVLGLALIIVLILLNRRRRSHSIATYFSTQAHAELSRLYRELERPGYGMDEVGFVGLMAQQVLQPNKVSGAQAIDLFRHFDRNGHNYLALADLLDLIANVIQSGILPTLDSYGDHDGADFEKRQQAIEAARNADPVSTWLVRQDVAAIDMFQDRHMRVRPGEPMRLMRTTAGGIVTIVFVIGALAIVTILTAEYFFDNVVQSVSSVPSAIIEAQYEGNAAPEVSLRLDVTLVGAQVRLIDPTKPVVETVACANADGTCTGTAVGFLGLSELTGSIVNTTTPTCFFDEMARSCTATITCNACHPNTATPLEFNFRFAHFFFAQGIRVRVTAFTGVFDPKYVDGQIHYLDSALVSRFESDIAPVVPGEVFVGDPATVQAVALTPTYFTAPPRPFTFGNENTRHKGALLYNRTAPVVGNTANFEGIDMAFGVPVRVIFNTEPSALLITRTHRQSEFQLISALLGGVSGFAALLTVLVQKLDAIFVHKQQDALDHVNKQRQKKFEMRSLREETDPNFTAAAADADVAGAQAAAEADAAEAAAAAAALTVPVTDEAAQAREDFLFQKLDASPEEHKLVAGLVASGMPLHVALEHLRLVQTVANAGERERTMQAPTFPNVDRFLRHDHRGGGGATAAAGVAEAAAAASAEDEGAALRRSSVATGSRKTKKLRVTHEPTA